MVFMPIYPVTCPNGHKCDVYAKVGARHKILCPECKLRASINFQGLGGISAARTTFSGDRQFSRTESFPRRSVAKARRLMGEDVGQMIQDDGRVKMRDSGEALRYFKRKREVQRMSREKRGEDPDYLPPES